jgi:acetyltransferase (GNAT) family protein
MTIRAGIKDDLPSCCALLEAMRARYQTYEPQFWKRAPNAAKMSEAFLGMLTAQPVTLFLVAEAGGKITGFLTARPQPVPPVFEPGATAFIDDFCVLDDWAVTGASLLREARAKLKERGFAQVIVVSAFRDDAKMEMLKREDLSLASAWWVGPP